MPKYALVRSQKSLSFAALTVAPKSMERRCKTVGSLPPSRFRGLFKNFDAFHFRFMSALMRGFTFTPPLTQNFRKEPVTMCFLHIAGQASKLLERSIFAVILRAREFGERCI
jgi:hypothetical protein